MNLVQLKSQNTEKQNQLPACSAGVIADLGLRREMATQTHLRHHLPQSLCSSGKGMKYGRQESSGTSVDKKQEQIRDEQ